MRMRLRPLRGQTYETRDGNKVIFLEKQKDGMARIVGESSFTSVIKMDDLVLPIIDTKDYEKIAEDKKRHD